MQDYGLIHLLWTITKVCFHISTFSTLPQALLAAGISEYCCSLTMVSMLRDRTAESGMEAIRNVPLQAECPPNVLSPAQHPIRRESVYDFERTVSCSTSHAKVRIPAFS